MLSPSSSVVKMLQFSSAGWNHSWLWHGVRWSRTVSLLPPPTNHFLPDKTFMQMLARPGLDPVRSTPVDILILSVPCPPHTQSWSAHSTEDWSHKLSSSRAPPWQFPLNMYYYDLSFRKNNTNYKKASLFEFSRLFQYEKSPWEPFSVRWRENGGSGEPTEGGEVPGRGSWQEIRRG